MDMQLPAEEPAAGPWREVPLSDMVDLLLRTADATAGRPAVVAVDGRSASGKTTLARRLCGGAARSAMVSTDDIAWHHSFFDWDDLLATGVLEPVHRGEPVRYRPPAWDEHGRAGAVEVPSGLDLLVVEGVGCARRRLAPLLDAVVWVQSDVVEAERRGLARDIASGENGTAEQTIAFWHDWGAQEQAVLARERPWERACVVVAGTPPWPCDEQHVVIAPPGPGAGVW
jgi:uridine kinase